LATGDEAMVVDQRSRLRPAQIVEQKLRHVLLRSRQAREPASPPSQMGPRRCRFRSEKQRAGGCCPLWRRIPRVEPGRRPAIANFSIRT